jgi:hypothetical protein
MSDDRCPTPDGVAAEMDRLIEANAAAYAAMLGILLQIRERSGRDDAGNADA